MVVSGLILFLKIDVFVSVINPELTAYLVVGFDFTPRMTAFF